MSSTTLYLLETLRTQNDAPDVGQLIGDLWMRHLKNPAVLAAPLKYGVYFDYATNYRGAYRIGIATENIITPEPLVLADNAHYQVFPVDTTTKTGVIDAWQAIWAKEAAGLLNRAYSVDFEKYYLDGTIDIYIALNAPALL